LGLTSAVTEIPHELATRFRSLLLTTAFGALAAYQGFVSPLLLVIAGPACRFEPTCSQYARQALVEYGLGHGLWLGALRVLRCRPLGGWGYDPVPSHPPDAQHHT